MRSVVLTGMVLFAGAAAANQAGGSRVTSGDRRGELFVGDGPAAAVTPEGVRHEYRVRTEHFEKGSRAYFEYVVDGEARLVAGWAIGDDGATRYEPLAARPTADGRCLGLAARTIGRGGARHDEVVLLEGTRVVRVLVPNHDWSSGALLLDGAGRPVAFGRHLLGLEMVAPDGRVREVLGGTMYDWGAGRSDGGHFHLTAYDYDTRSLRLAVAREGLWDWHAIDLDGPESGWQHSVAARGERFFVLYYYFRNAFNRGLRLAVLRNGELEANHTYARALEHNLGWEPLLGIAPDGSVEVRYLENVDEEARRADRFPTVDALLARRVGDYTGGWEDEHRDLFLFGGADAGYSAWRVFAPRPPHDEATLRIDAEYDYDPALVMTFPLELRYGSLSLGVSYARNVVGEQIAAGAGEAAGRSFQFFAGYLGFDRLFLGHDVRLTVGEGRFRGAYRDDDGPRVADTGLRTVELALLNQWRIQYGLQYRRYDLLQPLYAYYAARDATEYVYAGTAVVDAEVHRVEAFIGYSNLDYLAKYETRYSGLGIDAKASVGAGILRWDEVEFDGHGSSATGELALGASLRLSYLLYRRFHGLRGAGFYLRAGYEATALSNGIVPGRPAEREEKDASESNLSVDAVHHQILHGPFGGAGLIY